MSSNNRYRNHLLQWCCCVVRIRRGHDPVPGPRGLPELALVEFSSTLCQPAAVPGCAPEFNEDVV